MRLIDADAVMEDIKTSMNCLTEVGIPINAEFLWGKLNDALGNAETVDAEPVRHGHWIEDDDGDGRHCSICGEDYCYIISNCELYNYCPNCGAKMDEVEE